MKYRLRDGLSLSFAVCLGLAISTGHPAGIAAAVAMPIPCLMQKSRGRAFANAFGYYAAGLWPMIPGVSRFTGHSALPILLWACASALLAVPWILAWTSGNQFQYLWRAPLAEIAGTIPPIGLVGFISPLTGSGYLFPGTGWPGLIATMMVPSIVLALDSIMANRRVLGGALSGVVALGLGSQCLAPDDVKPPAEWDAVSTNFGDVSRPFQNFVAASSIERRIAASSSRVIIFPESVVPLWSDATSDFWRKTLADCRTRGQTVAIGAGLPRELYGPKKEAAEADLIKSYDFSAALRALRSDDDGRHSAPEPGSTANTLAAPFDNALLVLGAESTVFYQRVPVPLGMWQPIGNRGVPLRVNSPGVVTIDGQRAAILICYEQILTFPVLAAMLESPSVVVGISNMYWFADTTIPRYQASALRAWAKLFRLPYLLAVNS